MSQAAATRAYRPVAMGTNGVVTSAHQLASVAGLRVLMEGGNAFDATAATLNVVEPYFSGMGGFGTLLAYIAKEKRIRFLNFDGRLPHCAEPSLYTEETKKDGILSSVVPGSVAGWMTLYELYGTMDRERLFAPAIYYAEEGFPITFHNGWTLSGCRTKLISYPTSASIFLPGGKIPKAGTIFKQPQLGGSLRLIARGGQDVFYRGELAQRIARTVQELGGLITQDDLGQYQAQWQEPITISYRGFNVSTAPPNLNAFQMLETLKIMEGLDGTDLIYGSPKTLHLLMEAIKLAVTDRIQFAGDPDVADIPVETLISQEYASKQRKRIHHSRAATVMGERWANDKPAGSIAPGLHGNATDGNTTHFAVADKDGNVVTVTQSLGSGFGSGIALGDTGIFINNRTYNSEIDPGSPAANIIGPWRLVESSAAPTQVFKDGKFYLSIGTPGSYGILQTTTQMLMHVLDFGMNIQQAIEAPRFYYCEGTRVQMEERFSIDARASLQELGHQVEIIDAWSPVVGGAHGIRMNAEQGVLQGGADPRRDGYAIAW